MIIIEFFGSAGSGKTYFKKKLIFKYFKLFKAYDYKTINLNFNNNNFFIKYYFKLIKHGLIKKIKKIFLVKPIKFYFLSYFFSNYNKKIYNYKLNQKNLNKILVINKLIKNSNFNNVKKENFFRWAKEEVSGFYLAKKNKNKNSILIDSEGLIQRLFIYCYKKKNKKKIIKQYLNTIDLPDILIFFKNVKFKKNRNLQIDSKEIGIIFSLTVKYLKKRKILLLNGDMDFKILYKKINNKLKYHNQNNALFVKK